jgi:hypothetical protein
VKSRIRIRIEVKMQELWKLNMEQWMAMIAPNGGMEAQSGTVDGL